MCGHLGAVGVIRLITASAAFTASWGVKTVLDGENNSAYSFFLPRTISDKSMADTMAELIPHLLKPVAA